jgi:general secretion pathway protein I
MRAERQSGFSLLEVLVAFVLLSTVVTLLLQVFAGGLRNLKVADEYSVAVVLAESRIAEVGRVVPLEPGDTGGEWKGFRWRTSIQEFEVPELAPGVSGPPPLFSVSVTVSWGEGRAARSFRLDTLRAGLSPGEEA